MNLLQKEKKLIDLLKGVKSCAIAFSGGTDSTLLLYYLSKLNIKTKAYTFHSYLYPEKELQDAVDIAKKLNIKHQIINIDPLNNIKNINSNPYNRCYICKKYMFNILKNEVEKEKLDTIIEGSNFDDMKDYRPGFKAVQEIAAISPLNIAELTKNDIRKLLKKANLNYKKPSFACYFSRFPYNTNITFNHINKISKCEEYIHSLGCISARVRFHNDIIRIESNKQDMKKIINNNDIKYKIIDYCKSQGFLYVCLDLEGYITGSMNKEIVHNV